MSTLTFAEKSFIENVLGMGGAYVLSFTDRTFSQFVNDAVRVEIFDAKYTVKGASKAKVLRSFWEIESDLIVGKLLLAFYHYLQRDEMWESNIDAVGFQKFKKIVDRLHGNQIDFSPLKEVANQFDAKYLSDQILRIENSLESDPALAIGTSKELIETVCKTILEENKIPLLGNEDVPKLVRMAAKELKLLPSDIPDSAKGSAEIKKLLNNFSSIVTTLAELRNLYGTGHGKSGKTSGLQVRHAKLAVGSAVTVAQFMFDTFNNSKRGSDE